MRAQTLRKQATLPGVTHAQEPGVPVVRRKRGEHLVQRLARLTPRRPEVHGRLPGAAQPITLVLSHSRSQTLRKAGAAAEPPGACTSADDRNASAYSPAVLTFSTLPIPLGASGPTKRNRKACEIKDVKTLAENQGLFGPVWKGVRYPVL